MLYYLLAGLLLLAAMLIQQRRTGEILGGDGVENLAILAVAVLAWPPIVAMIIRDYVRQQRRAKAVR